MNKKPRTFTMKIFSLFTEVNAEIGTYISALEKHVKTFLHNIRLIKMK